MVLPPPPPPPRISYSLDTAKLFTTYYYSTIAPFYLIRVKERAKYATLLHSQNIRVYYMLNHRIRCMYKAFSLLYKMTELLLAMVWLTGHPNSNQNVNGINLPSLARPRVKEEATFNML